MGLPVENLSYMLMRDFGSMYDRICPAQSMVISSFVALSFSLGFALYPITSRKEEVLISEFQEIGRRTQGPHGTVSLLLSQPN